MGYSYQIYPRPETLGGGWKLQLLENGEEVGGGVFPPIPTPELPDFDEAYQDAMDEAEGWLSRCT